MKLGTRLTLYLSLIIILVLSGYGYFHITSRREVLTQSMRLEVQSLAEALNFSLEKISLPRELIYIQELLDSISKPERTLGVIFYHRGKNHLFHSQALTGNNQFFWEFILQAMEKDRVQENFGTYGGAPVYSYSFGLKDAQGRVIGGVAIIQDISAIQKHIREAAQTIVLYIFALIAGAVTMVLWVTRKWLNHPMSKMTAGIKRLAQGDIQARINLHGRDELSELAQSFNRVRGSTHGWRACAKRSKPSLRCAQRRRRNSLAKSSTSSTLINRAKTCRKFATGNGTSPNKCASAYRHCEDAGRRRQGPAGDG